MNRVSKWKVELPREKIHILICNNVSCHVRVGAREIYVQKRKLLFSSLSLPHCDI